MKLDDSKNSNTSSISSKISSSKQQITDDNKILTNNINSVDVSNSIKAKTNKTIKEEEEDSLFTISENEDKIDNIDIKNMSSKFSNFSKITMKEENNSSSSFKDENKLIDEINKQKKILEFPAKKKQNKNSILYNTQQIPKSKNFVYHNNNNNLNNNLNNKNIQNSNNLNDRNSVLFNNKNNELNSRNKKDSIFNNGLTTLYKTNENNNISNTKKNNKTTTNINIKKKEIEPNEIIEALLENKYLNKLDKYLTNDNNNFNGSVKTDITNKGFSETSSNQSNNSNTKFNYKNNITNFDSSSNIEKTQIKNTNRKPPSYQTLKEKVLKRKPQNNYY